MPQGGKRTPLDVSYSWGSLAGSPGAALVGQQGLETRFQDVYQPGQGIFSPGYPLAPLDPERVRVWDYPVGVNTIYTPRSYEAISFEELRRLADAHDITRLAIETRKDQLERLDWAIRVKGARAARPNAAARIAAIAEFWRRPDGERSFATWLRALMEDLLVLDAPVLELRRNRGGTLVGLDIVDGATIKVLVDETGRRPHPPAPAYEQIIKGRPWKLLTADELLYLPRNPRPHKAYGFGPVEQIVMTVNIALRRQVMQLQHFTEGNVPPGLLNAPDGWNVEQISQFQEWFDSVLAGNTGSRSRLVWGPSGARYQAFKEAPYKDDFDEWLARIVCYAFSLPPTAFIRQMNRATAESSQDTAATEGLAPLMLWVKRLADNVTQDLLGQPDLEFAWGDLTPADPAEQAKIIDTYVRDGVYAVNEARGLLGLDPVPGGDQPMIYGTQGAMPLEGSSAARQQLQRGAKREHSSNCGCGGGKTPSLRKYNTDFEDEARVPKGQHGGGEWTTGGDGEFDIAATRGTPCDGFPAGCQTGGSYGSGALFRIDGRNLCWDCAVKSMDLGNAPAAKKLEGLEPYYIDPE